MWSVLVLALGLAACGGEDPLGPDAGTDAVPPDAYVDHSGPLFDPDRLIDVDIVLPAADWDALRVQSRSISTLFGSCLSQPFPDPFTYFRGSVTIDGTQVADVGIRKKGFLGSLDPDKPSLKIKFNEYVDGQRLLGLNSFTLNNSKQDPSFLRQCVTYQTFEAAGVPSSRCNFAHVTVNGADLGIFVHVEGGNKDFLRRTYADPDGNLYEGTLSDFRDGWTATFENKTNESSNDTSDLDAVVAALRLPDAELLAALDPIVDVDAFLTFWATEVLVTHWDGYAGNQNNFFAYLDPMTGKFRFHPWGADGTLNPGPNPFGGTGATAVQAQGILAHRLYLLPETRDRYIARLRSILDTAWNETTLLAYIDRIEDLIVPVADPTGSVGLAAAIEGVRDFVRTRRATIDGELASGPPAWTAPLPDPLCFEDIGTVSGTFQTTWGTIGAGDPFAAGTGTMVGTVEGNALQTVQVGATAGLDINADPQAGQIGVVAWLADGTAELAIFTVTPPSQIQPNTDLPIDWTITVGALYHYTPSPEAFELVGLFFDGTLHLDAAGQTPGATVTGSYTGTIIKSPF
jgi:hypothetical protein